MDEKQLSCNDLRQHLILEKNKENARPLTSFSKAFLIEIAV